MGENVSKEEYRKYIIDAVNRIKQGLSEPNSKLRNEIQS